MEGSVQLYTQRDSHLVTKTRTAHQLVGFVGCIAILDVLEKRITSFHCPKYNNDSSIRIPYCSQYTDRAIAALQDSRP